MYFFKDYIIEHFLHHVKENISRPLLSFLPVKLHQMSRPPSKFGKSKWGVMSKKGMKMGLGGSGKAKDAVPASPGANTNDKKKNILQKIGFLQPT